MKIKAIIFDLDDTLYDCTGTLVEDARKRACRKMSEWVKIDAEKLHARMKELYEKYGPRCDVFNKIAEEFAIADERFIEDAMMAYNEGEIGEIELFPGAKEMLIKLRKKYKLILVTSGVYERQKKKIEILGLKDKFDMIMINNILTDSTKEDDFEDVLEKYDLKPKEVLCVGDRIHSEIKTGNRMGMITVQVLHGRFKNLKPKNAMEEPDYKISSITELSKLLEKIDNDLSIVCIGGGTGLSNILAGLKKYTENLTAIVTVTDAGRSSGIIRKELGILPPADIKNCLVALSERPEKIRKLLQYRFDGNGRLGDMNFGNLFIAALAKITGSFERAVEEAGEILNIKGRVLPATLESCNICAELEDGTLLKTDYEIYKRDNKSPIKRVFISPPAKAYDECIKSILEADIVTIGPGSLYTSIISNLLVEGIADALKRTNAKVIYIANLVTQKGQTEGFSLGDHVAEIEKYLGKNVIDLIIVNSKNPSKRSVEKCNEEGIEIVKFDLNENDYKIIKANVLKEIGERKDKGKHDPSIIVHDPYLTAEAVINAAGRQNG